MAEEHKYIGSELELFAMALNWKTYVKREIGPYIKGHVLEVGAGIGETAKALLNGRVGSWTCLEPDRSLAERIAVTLENNLRGQSEVPKIIVGDIGHPECNRKYDTILYIDVLEHIEKDELEIKKAAHKLNRDGCLIVLAPAHQYLYSPFDSKIGHFRRYHKKRLIAMRPADTKPLRVRYLDSVGCLASLSNKVILRAGIPSKYQITMWNRLLVPLSRIFDSALRYKIGKSIYIVWQKI